MKLHRSSAESELLFLGFIIFENKLKSGTLAVVKTLKKASIRQAMCTGDNILTSISVSRECELVDPEKRIFVPRFVSGKPHEPEAQIVWEDVDDSGVTLDPITFKVIHFCFISSLLAYLHLLQIMIAAVIPVTTR